MSLISGATPSSRLADRVIADMVMKSMYSRIVGMSPEPTIGGIAAVTSSIVANGISVVTPWVSRGCSRRMASVARASVPSEPMISCVRS